MKSADDARLDRIRIMGIKPTAWMFQRRYGSGLSFVRPDDYTDEDGELIQPIALYTLDALKEIKLATTILKATG